MVKPEVVCSLRLEVASTAEAPANQVPLQRGNDFAEPVANPLQIRLPVVHPNANAIKEMIIEATGRDTRGWDPTAYYNRWVPLRAMGGNSILLRTRPPGHPLQTLILFPRIERGGLELWFHSNWHGNSMQLQEVDALELCPQGQFWPKCMWCGKFHLPFETHRVSRAHRRFCANYIRPIEVEEPGSARREQLSSNLRQDVRAYRPVADMAQMFAP